MPDDQRPRRPPSAEAMTVVSFKAPREQGSRLVTAMKRVALDQGEAVQETYLRACSEFLARQPDDGAPWRELHRLAGRRGEDVWELHRQALAEFLDRHGDGSDGA